MGSGVATVAHCPADERIASEQGAVALVDHAVPGGLGRGVELYGRAIAGSGAGRGQQSEVAGVRDDGEQGVHLGDGGSGAMGLAALLGLLPAAVRLVDQSLVDVLDGFAYDGVEPGTRRR